jgi:hypothetical protein
MMLMQKATTPQAVFDKLTPVFKAGSWRVKQAVLMCFEQTLNEYVSCSKPSLQPFVFIGLQHLEASSTGSPSALPPVDMERAASALLGFSAPSWAV